MTKPFGRGVRIAGTGRAVPAKVVTNHDLAKIVDTAPEVANIESYARVVREKWRMRALIQTCQRISAGRLPLMSE